ncbi:hypothetical protein FOYG_17228 [Fusarium oxysporum NRRL 32931]|uniref:Uncharacterized protein n=1 Tax=Fusarium oxysporum NRRL 32931 TaxID=660029 RepID=W9HF83_FUSOX|nr:hypothetical protein FOYG_17228 [Fusarium oxysporum NRRL 32931]
MFHMSRRDPAIRRVVNLCVGVMLPRRAILFVTMTTSCTVRWRALPSGRLKVQSR